MKNYGDVKFPKGIVGYESENGYNNWWYPSKNNPVEIPMNVTANHLHLWKNQDPMLVFAIPRCIFHPPDLFEKNGRKQYIAIWFHKEVLDEIIDTQNP